MRRRRLAGEARRPAPNPRSARRGPAARRRAAALLALPLAATVALLSSCGTGDGDGRPMRHALPADADFTHPGVLVGEDQLSDARRRVTAGQQPWLRAYLTMRDSRYGAYAYRPRPYDTVLCPEGNAPARGCAQERADAIAAYTQALLFTVTGKRQHAVKAREILDAWSGRLKGHGIRDAAWAASTWARAAEIVRHTPDAGWPEARVRRFEDMLRSVHLPAVSGKAPGSGGQDLVMTDAAISIAVFLDDHRAFDRALKRFRARVPAYYSGKDGVTRDTCRGLREVGRGLAATSHIAETAWHQGVDLYGEVEGRLRAALALHARYRPGEPVPGARCGGRDGVPDGRGGAGKPGSGLGPGLEVALHHLEDRLGDSLPAAHRLAAGARPTGTDGLFVAWETLTHAPGPETTEPAG